MATGEGSCMQWMPTDLVHLKVYIEGGQHLLGAHWDAKDNFNRNSSFVWYFGIFQKGKIPNVI